MESTTVFYFLGFIACAIAIQCYQETVTGGSGSNPQTMINCTGNVFYCMKTVAMTDNVENVVRSCGNPLVCQDPGCSKQSGRTVCCCTTNLCNGAVSKTITVTMIVSMTLFMTCSFIS